MKRFKKKTKEEGIVMIQLNMRSSDTRVLLLRTDPLGIKFWAINERTALNIGRGFMRRESDARSLAALLCHGPVVASVASHFVCIIKAIVMLCSTIRRFCKKRTKCTRLNEIPIHDTQSPRNDLNSKRVAFMFNFVMKFLKISIHFIFCFRKWPGGGNYSNNNCFICLIFQNQNLTNA
uniref:Uncharacterized protein n=1 Tax=Cacopsylla melanoneura TaxID=428564 RepID=A0A8D8LNP5_9HEMI